MQDPWAPRPPPAATLGLLADGAGETLREVCSVRTYKYRALITLDRAGPVGPARHYPPGTHALTVRCARLDKPALLRYFPTAVYRADGQALTPGDADVVATIEVADEEAGEFLGPGQHITLWNGHDIGRGVISRRVFFTWAT